MKFEDEKDYVMRIIKEAVQVFFSLMFGKKYISVEQERKNPYEVLGMQLSDLLKLADDGKINEAENLVLEGIDYTDKEQVATAALFYQYLSEKDDAFLERNNYSQEEVIDGMKQIMQNAGCSEMLGMEDGEGIW